MEHDEQRARNAVPVPRGKILVISAGSAVCSDRNGGLGGSREGDRDFGAAGRSAARGIDRLDREGVRSRIEPRHHATGVRRSDRQKK
jgi:hypothetical protein